MKQTFSPVAARVLGCLVEKELATPEYYPLTLNALLNACNQKSNREPVMTLTQEDVHDGLEELRREQLVYKSSEGVRTARYCHHLDGLLHLEQEQLAVLAVLLLRGAQTVGELRIRSERMHSFADLNEVESVLQTLATHEPPLVTQLPRQPGRKEPRYMDLLREDIPMEAGNDNPDASLDNSALPGADRLSVLEQEVALLRQEVNELTESLEEFRAQFR